MGMDRLYELAVATPAGTLNTAPRKTPFPLENNCLKTIEIVIPTGHAGLTGIRVIRAGMQIIPFANNVFILADDEKLLISFDDEMTATGIVIETYNLDIYEHTHYLRAVVVDLPPRVPAAPVPAEPLPAALISTMPNGG